MADNSSILSALKGIDPADAMPFGAANTPQGSPTAIGNMLGALLSTPQRAVEAAQQAVPGLRKADVTDNPKAPEPNQPLYDIGGETALNLAGTGTPVAEAGSAGIFGGRLSKTANLPKLDQAMRMTDKGHPEDMVRQITGWERGADGQWRYEIPDDRSRMSYLNANGPAASMFQHPELFKAYPQLKNLQMFSEVNPNFPSSTGLWNLNDLTLQMSSQNANEARLGALHELQHAVQHIEGFSPGANLRMYEEMLKKPRAKAIAGDKTAWDLYDHTAGEVEARNVERRADFDARMRQVYSPQSTQAYANADQLRLKPMEDHPMLQLLRNGLK